MTPAASADLRGRQQSCMSEPTDLRALFHRLNNQLGTILAHAELLESKASGDAERARATQIVSSAIDAMTTVRSIRDQATSD